MKKHYLMMGSLAFTAACLSMSAMGDTDNAAGEAPAKASAAAVDAAQDAADQATDQLIDDEVGETVQAATQTADQAADSVQQAVQTVEGIDEELGVETAHQESGEHAEDGAQGEYGEGHSPEAMAQWMAKTQPGEHHRKLDKFVGQWDVTVQFWMAPGMPPQVNQGVSEIKWVLDGRFIQENFQSVMQMGDQPQTFKGFGLTGYDNVKQQYVGVWADTMSTAVIESTGQIDESTGGLVLVSKFDDPMTGEPATMRTVFTPISDDEVLMEAYKPLGDKEFKFLEIAYTRRP